MKQIFRVFEGNNGATYVLNASSWKNISMSLGFYQARSVKSKVLKFNLKIYLFILRILWKSKLKTAEECEQLIYNETNVPCKLGMDVNCSVLISPTRNKIIIHHHGNYFQKIAFGGSYLKVKNEANIYALFTGELTSFQVSEFYDFSDAKNKFVTFKLSNTKISSQPGKVNTLDSVLTEFFNVKRTKEIQLSLFIESELLLVIDECNNNNLNILRNYLIEQKTNLEDVVIPLGLVHNDFKPWNIKKYNEILIFDFEEAIPNGLPMLDLFNFYCDPIVRYKGANEVLEELFTSKNNKLFESYKNKLNINMSIEVLFNLYLIERITFWEKVNEIETANAYLNLFKFNQANA